MIQDSEIYNGRGFVGVAISHALLETLGHPFFWRFSPSPYSEVLDYEGNNYLHIAVETRSDSVCAIVSEKVGVKCLKEMFKHKNMDGKTPLDSAKALGSPNVRIFLQKLESTLG
eukprot:Trichotokara_eunicae@DN7931_c0_g1_i1.p1